MTAAGAARRPGATVVGAGQALQRLLGQAEQVLADVAEQRDDLALALQAGGEPLQPAQRGGAHEDVHHRARVLDETAEQVPADEPRRAKDDDVQLPLCLHRRGRYMARLGCSLSPGGIP